MTNRSGSVAESVFGSSGREFNFFRYAAQIITVALALSCGVGVSVVHAQTYPVKPIRMIVPYAPGGSTDISSRLLARSMATLLGQQFVIENKAGAAGALGINEVVRSAPDGYTIGVSGVGPTILANLTGVFTQYNTLNDLAIVAHMNKVELALVARKSLPASNIQELIALARANPGKLSAGNSGMNGPGHLSMVLLASRAGGEFTHVHYKGDGTVLQDLLANVVDLGILSVPGAAGALKAGTIKAIAMMGSRRSQSFPEIATVSEQGLADYDSHLFQVVVVPIKTPAAIIGRLNEAMNEALGSQYIKDEYAKQGMIPTGGSSRDAGEFVRRETEKWAKVFESLKGVNK